MFKDLLEFLLQLAPFAIALAGIALSYFVHKTGKASLYREKVYSKRMEAYEILYPALQELHIKVLRAFILLDSQTDKTTQAFVDSTMSAELGKVLKGLTKFHLFISWEVATKALEYTQLTGEICHFNTASQNPRSMIDSAFIDVINLMRKELGIEPLSREAQEIMGVVSKDIASKKPSS
jgi:hypothetical protein